MKKILILLTALFTISCQTEADLSLFNTNKEIAEKWIRTYESPSNYDLFESMVDKDIVFQSPRKLWSGYPKADDDRHLQLR